MRLPSRYRTRLRALVILLMLAAPIVLAARLRADGAGVEEREVTIASGAIELRGTLMTPRTAGLHPVVVFLHGSGPSTREGFRPYAEKFARLGVASLFFDKRGSGNSGGSWMTASLDDLVGDALAALALARSQPGIDPRRAGFWGVSQAGWIAARAAAQSPNVAFLIVISGGGATPRESELHSYRRALEKLGWNPSLQGQALEILDRDLDILATGAGRAELVAQLDVAAKTELAPLSAELGKVLPSEENRPNWAWVATYDPGADIARVRVPALLMFGDLDDDYPTPTAVAKWREGLAKAGDAEATVLVFPGAGHGIRMRQGYSGAGKAPFADGYFESMVGWLWMHVVDKPSL